MPNFHYIALDPNGQETTGVLQASTDAEAITQLAVGEALVSTLQDKGIPTPVQRVIIRPPHSRIGPASVEERQAIMGQDPNMRRYGKPYDPRSAHEVLLERTAASARQQQEAELEMNAAKEKAKSANKSSGSTRQTATEAFIKSMVRSMGSSLGRKIFRGILGSVLK